MSWPQLGGETKWALGELWSELCPFGRIFTQTIFRHGDAHIKCMSSSKK